MYISSSILGTSFLPNHFVEKIGRVKAGSTMYEVIFGTKCEDLIFALKVIDKCNVFYTKL